MNTFTQKIRSTSICLVTAAVIAAPGIGHAGWFSNKVSTASKKVTQVVKSTNSQVQNKAENLPGPWGDAADFAENGIAGIKDRVEDMAAKLEDMYSQIEDNRPLLNALKDGHMVQQLTEVVSYINESQQDYQDFAQHGVYTLRGDITDLVNRVTEISDKMNLDGKLSDQLQKAADMVDSIPATFLYPLVISGIDQSVRDMVARLGQLRDDLELIVTLPLERDVFLYPEQHRDALCSLVTDSATQLAVLNARIDYDAWTIAKIGGLMPEDLTISATVVGGGGATVSKFPVQYIVKAVEAILEVIQLRLDSYSSIADTLDCSA